MDRKRRVRTLISSAAIAAAVFASVLPAQAQIGGFGTSSAGGSGGTPTGPTNFTGIYGQSSSGSSGGFSTGPTNFSTSGFGLSTGAGSGGRATGPTNPSSVRGPGADQQQHARIWRRPNLRQLVWHPKHHGARGLGQLATKSARHGPLI